jgi:hypothetical protein
VVFAFRRIPPDKRLCTLFGVLIQYRASGVDQLPVLAV